MNLGDFPELGTMADLARFLRLKSPSGARRLALRTLPTLKLGRRLFVRRASLMAHLQSIEEAPPPPIPTLPPPDPEIVAALRRPPRVRMEGGRP